MILKEIQPSLNTCGATIVPHRCQYVFRALTSFISQWEREIGTNSFYRGKQPNGLNEQLCFGCFIWLGPHRYLLKFFYTSCTHRFYSFTDILLFTLFRIYTFIFILLRSANLRGQVTPSGCAKIILELRLSLLPGYIIIRPRWSFSIPIMEINSIAISIICAMARVWSLIYYYMVIGMLAPIMSHFSPTIKSTALKFFLGGPFSR